MIYMIGPGHGGPAMVANAYLEGTYSEYYPNISQDEEGMKKLFKQFSFPGGIPSHVAPETPGSIHEGGELGYALSHAYGAAFDNPDLIVACVVGDGEAETGPLATGYMAPEQAQGEPPSQASDVFSLGLILYEMVTRSRARAEGNLLKMLHRIDHENPAQYVGQVPEPFASILRQALAIDPSERRISMAQIADRLAQ